MRVNALLLLPIPPAAPCLRTSDTAALTLFTFPRSHRHDRLPTTTADLLAGPSLDNPLLTLLNL